LAIILDGWSGLRRAREPSVRHARGAKRHNKSGTDEGRERKGTGGNARAEGVSGPAELQNRESFKADGTQAEETGRGSEGRTEREDPPV